MITEEPLPLGAWLTLAVICLVNDWIADPDDDPRPAPPR